MVCVHKILVIKKIKMSFFHTYSHILKNLKLKKKSSDSLHEQKKIDLSGIKFEALCTFLIKWQQGG